MIPKEIVELFPRYIRSRGEEYFARRWVVLNSFTPDRVEASVRGTTNCTTGVTLPGQELMSYWCTCPYAQSNGPCKHLWAVLRAAEERGSFTQLDGNGPRPAQAPPKKPVPDWKRRLQQLRAQ